MTRLPDRAATWTADRRHPRAADHRNRHALTASRTSQCMSPAVACQANHGRDGLSPVWFAVRSRAGGKPTAGGLTCEFAGAGWNCPTGCTPTAATLDRHVRQVLRRAVRARLRHDRRQQPAPHPAVQPGRQRRHAGQDPGRAARDPHHPRRGRRRDRHHPEHQEPGREEHQPTSRKIDPHRAAREGRRSRARTSSRRRRSRSSTPNTSSPR